MKMKESAWVFVAVMLIMATIIIYTLTITGGIESKSLPLLASGLCFVLAAAGFLREVTAKSFKETATEDHEGKKEAKIENWRGYLINMAWALGFLLGIYFIGLIPSIFIFVLFYMKFLGTKWRTAIICGVLTPLFIYLVFERAIGIVLYRGLFFGA